MVADYFTKPLQGALFKRFRDVIMGVSHPNTLPKSNTTGTQERVVDKVEKKSPISHEQMESGNKENANKKLTWSEIVKGCAGSERPAGTIKN